LKPSAVAGGPSVTLHKEEEGLVKIILLRGQMMDVITHRLTHNRCIAVSGSGTPLNVDNKIAQISPMLQEIKKHMNACILA